MVRQVISQQLQMSSHSALATSRRAVMCAVAQRAPGPEVLPSLQQRCLDDKTLDRTPRPC